MNTLKNKVLKKAIRFANDAKGDFAQNALILVLVVIVAIAALTDLGAQIVQTFNEVTAAL